VLSGPALFLFFRLVFRFRDLQVGSLSQFAASAAPADRGIRAEIYGSALVFFAFPVTASSVCPPCVDCDLLAAQCRAFVVSSLPRDVCFRFFSSPRAERFSVG